MKPSFELHPDVEKLIGFLASRQRATYVEMSNFTGRQINGRDRYVLQSARRHLESKQGICFAVERGVGLVRATNGQVAKLSTSQPIEKIRRETRRAGKRQTIVNIQALTPEDRLAFDVGRSGGLELGDRRVGIGRDGGQEALQEPLALRGALDAAQVTQRVAARLHALLERSDRLTDRLDV